jgi:predicted peroxiredoxin
MKNLLLLVFTVCIYLSCNSGGNQSDSPKIAADTVSAQTQSQARDGVFIHITESYNDPHRLLMPLKMATIMADNKDVLVYLDIHAVEFVSKNAKDINFKGFESAQTYIKELLKKNVEIYACPTCLKVAGINETDLIAGVQPAKKDRFFDFTKGRILNLDY